eukprot:9481952-Pyramimonas_sp.AAC.1
MMESGVQEYTSTHSDAKDTSLVLALNIPEDSHMAFTEDLSLPDEGEELQMAESEKPSLDIGEVLEMDVSEELQMDAQLPKEFALAEKE